VSGLLLSQGWCVPEGNARAVPSRNSHVSQKVRRRTFGMFGHTNSRRSRLLIKNAPTNKKLSTGSQNVISLTACFVRDSNLVTRCLGGETIIVPVVARVGDLGSIYTLNEVGTRIWELLEGRTVDQIIAVITIEYNVAGEEIAKHVLDFLESLVAVGLIRSVEQVAG
jgi:hypothetical protein